MGGVGVGVAWLVTSCLLICGAIGCILPILPGHMIILMAAVAHRLMLGERSGLHWWSFVILCVLVAISQILEILSGAAGTKWFGGSHWGALGALIGGIVGMFFIPFGLVLGPLIGGVAFELIFAKKRLQPAAKSAWGSLLGTGVGLVLRLIVALAMVATFFLDALVW